MVVTGNWLLPLAQPKSFFTYFLHMLCWAGGVREQLSGCLAASQPASQGLPTTIVSAEIESDHLSFLLITSKSKWVHTWKEEATKFRAGLSARGCNLHLQLFTHGTLCVTRPKCFKLHFHVWIKFVNPGTSGLTTKLLSAKWEDFVVTSTLIQQTTWFVNLDPLL